MNRLSMLTVFVTVAAVVSLASPGRALAQRDLRVGTWELDVAKSKYTPGPPPRSETRTYETQGRALKVNIESTDSKGNRVSLSYTANDDGKDYPMTGLSFADAIAVHRVDAYRFETETKKDGKVIGVTRALISKDGKILTLTSTTSSTSGDAIHNVAVYDKHSKSSANR